MLYIQYDIIIINNLYVRIDFKLPNAHNYIY